MAEKIGVCVVKLLTLSFWSAASMATSSFVPVDLPPDLPKRAPGLWEIRTQGTLSSGQFHYTKSDPKSVWMQR